MKYHLTSDSSAYALVVRKKEALRFSLLSFVGTIGVAGWALWDGADPGWLVPITFFGGILVLSGLFKWYVLDRKQKQRESGEFSRWKMLFWIGAVAAFGIYLVYTGTKPPMNVPAQFGLN